VGNVPKFSHDADFGCATGFIDFSVRVDEDSRRMPHQAALWKHWNGWISESETLRTTPPYTGTIGAVDRKHTLKKLLLIPMAPAGTSSGVNTPTYSLEYVSGAGLNAGQQTGVVIRYFGNALPAGGALPEIRVRLVDRRVRRRRPDRRRHSAGAAHLVRRAEARVRDPDR
jgi:hypothetical protein